MKNNIIELHNYMKNEDTNCSCRTARRSSELCKWMVSIADTIMTGTISICTIFCMYLAYTML